VLVGLDRVLLVIRHLLLHLKAIAVVMLLHQVLVMVLVVAVAHLRLVLLERQQTAAQVEQVQHQA
jgi:hypothetical protein